MKKEKTIEQMSDSELVALFRKHLTKGKMSVEKCELMEGDEVPEKPILVVYGRYVKDSTKTPKIEITSFELKNLIETYNLSLVRFIDCEAHIYGDMIDNIMVDSCDYDLYIHGTGRELQIKNSYIETIDSFFIINVSGLNISDSELDTSFVFISNIRKYKPDFISVAGCNSLRMISITNSDTSEEIEIPLENDDFFNKPEDVYGFEEVKELITKANASIFNQQ